MPASLGEPVAGEVTSGGPRPPYVSLEGPSGMSAEIYVPALLIDATGERGEFVEIDRGQAFLLFGSDSVQLRYSGSDSLCDSFSVIVRGHSDHENRTRAVDIADRLLLG